MEIFTNPWAIGIGTTVIGGLIVGVILLFLQRKPRQTDRQSLKSPVPPPQRDDANIPEPQAQTAKIIVPLIFVNRTPEELTQPFRELTDYQAKRATEVYLNKWLRVEAPLIDIWDVSPDLTLVITTAPDINALNIVKVLCRFDKSWVARLNHLRKGDAVKLEGRIAKLDVFRAELEECRLISP